MTRLLSTLFLFIAHLSQAATYYVSASGSAANDGLSTAAPWNLSKLNATALTGGDAVNFNRGDVFTSNPVFRTGVTYGMYGSGAQPVFSGLSQLTNWTSAGVNIYYTTLDVPELNVVLINGKMRPMGRYPKTGALYYSANGGDYIKGTSVSAIPFDPTGAEIVLNKIEQVTDRHRIQSRSADTLKLVMGGGYHTNFFVNNGWPIAPSQPYFIQGTLGCLTQLYDWYYDGTAKRLYVYFPTAPGNYVVKAATRENLLQIENVQNAVVKNLDFEGANLTAIQTYGATKNVKFYDVNLRYSGNGTRFDGSARGVLFKRGSIQNTANNGITAYDTAKSIVIDSVLFHNIGILRGAGASSDHNQQPIYLAGDSITVSHCTLDSSGYHGIVLHGNYTSITDNTINCPCLTKRDCGGIYEYQFTQDRTNNTPPIVSTAILHARNKITNVYGPTDNLPTGKTLIDSHGEYVDAGVNHLRIESTTMVNGASSAIFEIDAGSNLEIANNYTDNWGVSGLQVFTASRPLRNLTLTGNRFLARAGQFSAYYNLYGADNIALMGSIANNTYNRIGSDLSIRIDRNGVGSGSYRLSYFKQMTGLEAGSISNVRPAMMNSKLLKYGNKLMTISQ